MIKRGGGRVEIRGKTVLENKSKKIMSYRKIRYAPEN